MDFIPHDQETVDQMLKIIGFQSIEELFQDIPKDLILDKLNIRSGISEADRIDPIYSS